MRTLVGINITSPYQLLSFLSYYEKKCSCYCKIIIFKYDYWGSNQIYNRYLEYFQKIGGILIQNSSDLTQIIHHLQEQYNGDIFDFVTVNTPAIKLKLSFKKSKSIIIADGFGYYGNFLTLISTLKREKKVPIFSPTIMVTSLKYFLKKILFKFFKYEEYTLLSYKDLTPNDEFIFNFKKVIMKLNGVNFIETPSLIFLDQPLVKLGILNQTQYELLIESIYEYSTSLGLTFFIKEHPSSGTRHEKYNIIEFDGILEELCILNRNIKYVISHSSTGLFNILYLRDDIKIKKTINNSHLLISNKQRKIFSKIKNL